MTGLEKIIQAIEADAKANADQIIVQAKKEAEQLITAAREEAEKKCVEIASKSEADVKSVLSRAESGAKLQEKKLILNTKQQMINEIIGKAMEKLMTLPDKEYFDMILQIVKKHAHKKSGKIVLSSVDLKRMPKNFNASLQNVLDKMPGASLTVSEETANIGSGFILVYGDVEENCSFDALFSEAKEDLQDKVNAFLFE